MEICNPYMLLHFFPFYLHCGTSNWRLETMPRDEIIIVRGAYALDTPQIHPRYIPGYTSMRYSVILMGSEHFLLDLFVH